MPPARFRQLIEVTDPDTGHLQLLGLDDEGQVWAFTGSPRREWDRVPMPAGPVAPLTPAAVPPQPFATGNVVVDDGRPVADRVGQVIEAAQLERYRHGSATEPPSGMREDVPYCVVRFPSGELVTYIRPVAVPRA